MVISGLLNSIHSQSLLLMERGLPKEIVIYADDIELLTLFSVSPSMFNKQIQSGHIAPICIKDTSVIKYIVQTISTESRECKTAPIDVRGLLILKYDNMQEIRIYYNMSYLFLKARYQIPVSFSYYLDSIRRNVEKEERPPQSVIIE